MNDLLSIRLAGLLAVLVWLLPVQVAALAPPLQQPTVVAAPGSADDLLFSDGFESGDLSLWTGKNGLTVQQTQVLTGVYAVRATSDGAPAYARQTLSAPQTEIYYRLRFKVLAQGTNPIDLMGFRTASEGAGSPVFGLSISAAGYLSVQNDVADTTAESTARVVDEAWHEVQAHIRVGEAQSESEVWLDGVYIDALSGAEAVGSAAIGRIELGDSEPGRSYDVVFDDLLVDTAYISSSQPTKPVVIHIETVPALAGVKFAIEDRTAVTNDQGRAELEVEHITDLRKRLKLIDSQLSDTTRATIGRWFWDRHTKVRAALDISHPVTWTFINLEGQPVAQERVTSLTLKSSHGEVHTVEQAQIGQPLWLHASRIVPTHAGLLQKDIYYSVERVVINGTNVVNRAQQRFFPTTQRAWTIKLMFYSARFRAQDALFGFPLGSGVRVVYPDESAITVPFGADRSVTVDQLPRGEYRVQIIASGVSPLRPLALTRDQDLHLEVFSQLDIAVVVTVLASLGIGLLLFGRPQILSIVFHPIASLGRLRSAVAQQYMRVTRARRVLPRE
ncbi:MAG TPA: hypothetical protein VFZ66_00975 [Herpetosiphonaceae bacterium]